MRPENVTKQENLYMSVKNIVLHLTMRVFGQERPSSEIEKA